MPNHLRAPAQHGDLLLSPEGSLVGLVRANEARLAAGQLWGQSLGEVRKKARAEVYQLATRYTSHLIEPESVERPHHPLKPPHPGPLPHSGVHSDSRADCGGEGAEKTLAVPQHWIIGGHQPELFHPGVWVKNAVVSGLATQLGGVGLNLVVDNDVCTGSSVRMPCGLDSAGMASLDWDVPRPQSPWEERPAPDAETFATFGARCREHLSPWGMEPLAASQDWGASPERGIVDRLVQLRCRFEQSAGIRNLELKVSDLAETQCFRRFLLGALRKASQLRKAYNSSLADYRATNRIHSRSHPVPPLDATAQGIEVPFWVWRAGETRRSRLFVEAVGPETLRLLDCSREVGTISTRSEETALQALSDLRQQGWKIRPRALTLTLFCRVWLGSGFVHGIGGAKYDELTDTLMQRWLGLTPPDIIVATATLRLLERFAGPPLEAEIARLQRELRLIRWNPELVQTAAAESVVFRSANEHPFAERKATIPAERKAALHAEKSALLASALDPATRHARIQSVNTALRATLTEYEHQVRHDLQQLLTALPPQQSLRSREFAANLFPAEAIQELFRRAMERVTLVGDPKSQIGDLLS